MNTGIWETLYQSVQKPHLDPVLTGFNANIDRIIRVTPALMKSFLQHKVPGFDVILPQLKQSLRYASADEVFISNLSVYQKISDYFSRSGRLAIGGQAGIAAVHLRALGIPSVTCAVPGTGPKTCSLLQEAGVVPVTFARDAPRYSDLPHVIFEYSSDLVPHPPGTVSRNNRFIVSPIHDASNVIIPDASMKVFLERIRACRRAFLSGYQYLRTEQEFVMASRQIQLIRSVHPLMRTHVECVSGAGPDVIAMMLRYVLPSADSIGLNERELGMFTCAVRKEDPASLSLVPSSPGITVHDAIALAEVTGVSRIHFHTFGYYILILNAKTAQPEVSRNALLFAAKVTADIAGLGKQILSGEGLQAFAEIQKFFGPDETPGIFTINDWNIILVPAYISQNVQKTTGLGDILSSTAFVADTI